VNNLSEIFDFEEDGQVERLAAEMGGVVQEDEGFRSEK
jgi:hypothetical protein